VAHFLLGVWLQKKKKKERKKGIISFRERIKRHKAARGNKIDK